MEGLHAFANLLDCIDECRFATRARPQARGLAVIVHMLAGELESAVAEIPPPT